MAETMSGVTLNNPAYIHPTALLYGKIIVEEGASIWPYVVMRSEGAEIVIGRYVNIQDFVMIHTTPPNLPTVIGDYTSVTHHSTIHGARIGQRCLIGINSTIYDGAVIGDNCIVGQHAYVKNGMQIPDNSIVVGSPAKIIRTSNNAVQNSFNALMYHHNALEYAQGRYRAWSGPEFDRWAMETMDKLHKELGGNYSVTND
jgi:carbonic anhydrase/acetyltransferase-like protein (isoleucine patch superfamily)